MKYLKYVLGLFLLLFTITIFVPSVEAEEVPAGVNSVYREVEFWEIETRLQDQLLFKSNRIFISPYIYDYFLFDLKSFAGSNPGGSLGSSEGIYFFESSSSTTWSNSIKFDDYNFDNFVDMTSYKNRWIEFRVVRTIGPGQSEESILNTINSENYRINILAISGSGLISQDSLYTYLTDFVSSFTSNRVDSAYNNGYDTAKNEFGYNDNGIIVSGDNAFNSGYQKGIQEAGDTKTSIINFIPGVLGAIFMFFFQIGQIGILGITIIDILGILVLISSLIFIIKFFF